MTSSSSLSNPDLKNKSVFVVVGVKIVATGIDVQKAQLNLKTWLIRELSAGCLNLQGFDPERAQYSTRSGNNSEEGQEVSKQDELFLKKKTVREQAHTFDAVIVVGQSAYVSFQSLRWLLKQVGLATTTVKIVKSTGKGELEALVSTAGQIATHEPSSGTKRYLPETGAAVISKGSSFSPAARWPFSLTSMLQTW